LESIFFIGSEPFSAEMPLRIVVPAAAAGEDALLTVVRACVPSCSEVRLNLGPDAPEAELTLLDYWTDLPHAERSRVWGVMGPVAGALMRFDDRPSVGFALLGSPVLARERAPNPQARSLLMAEYPDTWTLALDQEPAVDADYWRFRLATIVRERWGIALIEDDALADSVVTALQLVPSCRSQTVSVVSTFARLLVRASPEADWLDRELYARFSSGSDHRARNLAGWGAPPPVVVQARSAPADAEQKVLRGKRGRLFLAHDSHDSHRQIIGERALSSYELDAWERGTAARMAGVKDLGCLLIHLIGPAPQLVHADDLPGSLTASRTRPARQILERLGAMHPAPEVMYPLADLVNVAAVADPFGKTDSHWNDLGAYIAYEALIRQLDDRVPVRQLRRDGVSFQETCYIGDLGVKLRPQRAASFLRARIDQRRARLVTDNRVRNHGRMAIYECDAAPPATCLVFGDSWAYPVLLYLAESFRRLVFFHRVNVIDREAIQRERPQLVLVLLTERFCAAVPNDEEAIPFERVIAKKMRIRDLVPETGPPMQRHPYLHSVQLDRGLPDRAGLRLPPE
jgi:hypothetical protein